MKEEKDILFKHATRISVVCNFEHKVHNENNHINLAYIDDFSIFL